MLIAGHANPSLARDVANNLGLALAPVKTERFPDREVHIELLESPRGRDVFLLQPTSPPPDDHLFELLAMADATRRAGAARVTAVMPYFGYARQDRRTSGFEAVAARLVADLLTTAGVQHLIVLDLHTDAIEGFFKIPVDRLTAVPVLAEAIQKVLPENGIVVSPDLGAAKLSDSYARILNLPVAIVHKVRTGPEAVTARRVTGDVRGRTPIIVDDMISTGVTIEAAAASVADAGADTRGLIVAATHGLFVGACTERLGGLGIQHLFVTDSVDAGVIFGLTVEAVSIAPILADAIRGLTKA
jgi:ribose-phosphate pyrophosphokinase